MPRYLIEQGTAPTGVVPPHAGTTDVDLVLDLQVLAQIDAYRRLEANRKALGFQRGTNEEGQPQHFSWRRSIRDGVTIVVDLLCDAQADAGGLVSGLPGERRLSALKIVGGQLVTTDYVEREITAELLDEQGIVTETVRIAGVVAFIVLKALAFDDRGEEKDAHDLIYCLMHYGSGPIEVGARFAQHLARSPEKLLLERALAILRRRFASDAHSAGGRKDGPMAYARFLTDPGRRERDARNRQDAVDVVETFLQAIGGG